MHFVTSSSLQKFLRKFIEQAWIENNKLHLKIKNQTEPDIILASEIKELGLDRKGETLCIDLRTKNGYYLLPYLKTDESFPKQLLEFMPLEVLKAIYKRRIKILLLSSIQTGSIIIFLWIKKIIGEINLHGWIPFVSVIGLVQFVVLCFAVFKAKKAINFKISGSLSDWSI